MRLTTLLHINTLEEFVGQRHIIAPNKPLYKLIKKGDIPHLFFYGKPGTGKTTLAKLIAKELNCDFYSLNATSLKIEELRTIFKKYENTLLKPLIFIDEIHRMSKTQQEVLLPIMESYQAIIIGASTENPYYTLTNAIRSRGFTYEFVELQNEDLNLLLDRAINEFNINIDEASKKYLIDTSVGDARSMLNLLDFASKVDKDISLSTLANLRDRAVADGTNSNDTHYDLASALIKSMRGSDVDAALYYLARLIDGSERVEFITRRLVIFASEDIGNANPNALNIATSTMLSAKEVGYPEARIILAQCVVYLASSPKSNSSYEAINKALQNIKDGRIYSIPDNIKDKSIGYLYPHAFGGYVEQSYLSKPLKLYESKKVGFEKTLDDWLEKIKNKDK